MMSIRGKSVLKALLLLLVVTRVDFATAQDARPAKVERLLLEQSDVPGTGLETRLYLITYPPGMAAPLHHHPVAGLGYIIEGSALSAYEGEAPVQLTAGQSFQDKAMTPHTVFANANSDQPLRFLIAYTVTKGIPVIETP
jgi:quercetin dioxygenase-like cupin family protein